VLALDPLRVDESERSGLHGKHELRVKKVLRNVAQIHGNFHRLLRGLRVTPADGDETRHKKKNERTKTETREQVESSKPAKEYYTTVP
jgi:hypothetical protein